MAAKRKKYVGFNCRKTKTARNKKEKNLYHIFGTAGKNKDNYQR